MTQRIFLSSTCVDLVDLRSGLKESLEEMGYEVWASEFPGFPVDSKLHSHDNCLRNVERADQYVLIVNDRYGAPYDGAAYPKRPISLTRYEYERALECGKAIRVLVRDSIWSQRPVFQAARKSGVDLTETGLDPNLFEFLDFVSAQKKANWIHRFRDLPEARETLCIDLRREEAQNARQFEREVRALLLLQGYRGLEPEPTGVPYFLAETGDVQMPFQWAVRCVFEKHGRMAKLDRWQEFFTEFESGAFDRAVAVTNVDFDPAIKAFIDARPRLARKVKLTTPAQLLGELLDLREYIRGVREDYDGYPERTPRYLPLRTDLKKYFVPLACKGDYDGDLFESIDRFLEEPEMSHLTILGDFGTAF